MSAVQKIILAILGFIVLGILALIFLKPIMVKKNLPKPVMINTHNQPTLGNPAAKIQIVAFEDLKCANCARFNTQLMPYIKKHYIDTGLAKYTMINLAFVPGSLPAATAAHCIYVQNPNLFFSFIEYVFSHQLPENQNWATIPTLMNFANQIKGVNMDQLAQCLIASPYDQIMQDNLKQAMKIMTVVETPAVYVNGILVKPLTKSQIDLVMDAVK